MQVAHNSILALGLVGCGSNNARIAAMLRQLAVYYHKDEHNLFVVRIAQGLLHMGKGTMSISPYHSDRSQVCACNNYTIYGYTHSGLNRGQGHSSCSPLLMS